MTEQQKEKKKLTDKAYRERNKLKLKEKNKLYYEKNKETRKLKDKEYAEKNKEKIRENKKRWVEKNKEKIKQYFIENKEVLKEKRKIYNENNKDKIRESERIYRTKKMKEDLLYRIKVHTRNIIGKSIKMKGYIKNTKTQEILGCTFDEFKQHLESKFEPWMNWDNKGLYNGQPNYGWDIDHIIPLSSATTEEELIKLNHFSNLQPLCSHINRNVKRDNY